MNRIMAAVKTLRRLNRPIMNPVVGMTTASVSMNAVVSHCTVVSATWNLSMSGVSATFMSVSLRIMTKAAIKSAPIVSLCTLGSRPSSITNGPGSAADSSGARTREMDSTRCSFGRSRLPSPLPGSNRGPASSIRSTNARSPRHVGETPCQKNPTTAGHYRLCSARAKRSAYPSRTADFFFDLGEAK